VVDVEGGAEALREWRRGGGLALCGCARAGWMAVMETDEALDVAGRGSRSRTAWKAGWRRAWKRKRR